MVAKAVGRQGLQGGGTTAAGDVNRGGNEEQLVVLPVSEEERDVRLAELMSYGVDLPREMLLNLLRFALAVDVPVFFFWGGRGRLG